MADQTPLDLEPMYAAVYDVIRRYPPRSTDGARENARIWRAVEAAYAAMAPIVERTVAERIARQLITGLGNLDRDDHWGMLVRPTDVEELIRSILVTAPSEW